MRGLVDRNCWSGTRAPATPAAPCVVSDNKIVKLVSRQGAGNPEPNIPMASASVNSNERSRLRCEPGGGTVAFQVRDGRYFSRACIDEEGTGSAVNKELCAVGRPGGRRVIRAELRQAAHTRTVGAHHPEVPRETVG